MNVNGTRRIAASRERVWRALRDPLVLAACLPGCEELLLLSPGEYQGRMAGQVGTISTLFACRATLSEESWPATWMVAGHAQSATAGWVDGLATVTLAEEAGTTILGYRARVEAGGRLATLGERLLHGAAVRLADRFLTSLGERLEAEQRPAAEERAPPPPSAASIRPVPPSAEPVREIPAPQLAPGEGTVVLIVGVILWVMALLLLFASGGGH